MPARKKVKHGGKREGAGAPIKGGEQRIGATKSERNEYFRNRRAAERGKVTIPNDKTEYSSSGRGRGRPPTDPEIGPMVGDIRKNYLTEKKRQERKRQRISEIRRQAVAMRKDRFGNGDELLMSEDIDANDIIDINEISDTIDETPEKSVASSKSDYYEKLNQVKQIMFKFHPTQRPDIAVKILTTHDLDDSKLGLSITVREAKNHLEQRISHLSEFQIRERAREILMIVESHRDSEELLASLLRDTVFEFEVSASLFRGAGVVISDNFLTAKQRAKHVAREEALKLATKRMGPEKDICTKLAINIVNICKLSSDNRGNVSTLAESLGCHHDYAKRVLVAVRNKSEKKLFKRTSRKDSIVNTEWPNLLRSFLDQPTYSRPVPGKDSVSVQYGIRVPKILMLKSKIKILQEFKDQNPDCPFGVGTLMREIPKQYVCTGPRDFNRNVCVLHTNMRQIIKHLLKQELLLDVINSCRYIAAISLCTTDPTFNPLAPLTWKERCVTGNCPDCPDYSLTCPEDKQDIVVPLSQWKTKHCELKKKKIHSLFTEPIVLPELVNMFNTNLRKLSNHIYCAARQWEAYQAGLASLKPNTIMTVCDYQMNGTVLHKESTTSSHMGANTAQFAIYPVFLAVGKPDGSVSQGGMIFLSSDLKHDRHQVEVFHKRILSFVKEEFGVEALEESRYTDQCSQQFKSQYTVYDLVSNQPGIWVNWVFYETGEGKNLSDLLGALFKTAYIRGVATSDTTVGSAHTISEIINLARPNLNETSKKFDFIIIEEIKPFKRPCLAEEKGIIIKGIQKQHHLTRTPDNMLYTREIACKQCIQLRFSMCEACQKLTPVSIKEVPRQVLQAQDDDESSVEINPEEATESDGGASDAEEFEEEKEVTEEDFMDDLSPGSIVWARILHWHPAVVVAPHDVPDSFSHLITGNKHESLFVRRFVINDIKLVPINRLMALGTNKIDREKATKTDEIKSAYEMAVAVLRGDI